MVDFLRPGRQPTSIDVGYFPANPDLLKTWETQPRGRDERLFTDRYWLVMGRDRTKAFAQLSSLIMSRVVVDPAFVGVSLLYNDSGIGEVQGRDRPATIFTLSTYDTVPPTAETMTDELLAATNADLATIGSELWIPLKSQERVSATA